MSNIVKQHYPAALKAEAIEWLQKQWNENCELRARIEQLEAEILSLHNLLTKWSDANKEMADRIEQLEAAIEDAVDALEAMDLHMDNPLYERLRRMVA